MRGASNPYATDGERFEWYQRFDLKPTTPGEINERLQAGDVLQTMDIPGFLGPPARTDCETGVALYRLVQLWGTPNVPGMTAGALQLERNRTTWQYLFDVDYAHRPEDGEKVPENFYLSVYDYETDVSAGLSAFGQGETFVETAQREPIPSVSPPPDSFLEGVMALALNMVDQAVPATHKERWI